MTYQRENMNTIKNQRLLNNFHEIPANEEITDNNLGILTIFLYFWRMNENMIASKNKSPIQRRRTTRYRIII